MTLLQGAFLGLLQGLTEFLPISSSGHLALFEILFGFEEDRVKRTAYGTSNYIV